MNTTQTGLMVSIYRASRIGDCTNGGVSSKYDTAVLIGAEGPFEPSDTTPALYLTSFRGRLIATPEPLSGKALSGASGKWWMFGGNYVSSSDSRFPNDYPIPVYDRNEG
jgi:hypothetical protein